MTDAQTRFMEQYRKREAQRLNDRAAREHDDHRRDRPLCHASRANVGSCRCSCGGLYHGGRLPIYDSSRSDDQVDAHG